MIDADRCPHLHLVGDVPHRGFIQSLRCDAPKLRDMDFCVAHQRDAEIRVAAARAVLANIARR